MIMLRTCFKNTILFMIMILSCTVFSQDKRLAKADKKFADYAFIAARKRYLTMLENGYASAVIYKKLGDSYYFNAELKEALTWYEKLLRDYEEEAGPEYLFRYAQSLKHAARYEEADAIMEKFSVVSGNDRRAVFFTGTRDYLRFIALQSDAFELRKLSINSEYSEYAPGYDHQGQIVFASSRPGNGLSRTTHQWNEMPFSDLFSVDETAVNDSIYRPRKLKGKINTRFHESSTAFSKDGKTVYFTRNNYTAGKLRYNAEGTILLKLYRATRRGDKWENIEELPFNSDGYSVAHPALSPDGKQLYFASDMPGSRGMSDLYVAEIHQDGTFGTPRNLGDPINTEARETFPYIGDSGRLYFSGDGHTGLGGLDVFMAEPKKEGSFSTPYNLGKPVNSPADDFSFILNEHTKTGYFASNRSGGKGSDDIYVVTQTGQLISGVKEDYGPFEAMFTTHTDLAWQNQFPLQLDKKKDPDADADLTALLGSVPRFNIEKTMEGYPPFEATFITNADFEQQNQFPAQLNKKKRFKTGVDLAKLLGVVIYFDTAKANIRPDAATELQKIINVMRENPELKIDVRSHTDSRSSAGYNMALSERRVQSTITYMVETGGIDKLRITGRGYGESQLLNECKDGVKCSNEKHQLNRRSEFIVVE